MGSTGDHSIDKPLGSPGGARVGRAVKPRYRLVAPFPGVEQTSANPVPGAWRGSWKLAFLLVAAVCAWALAFGLFRLVTHI